MNNNIDSYSCKTLGCKVNQYESELIAENAKLLGLKQNKFPESDIVIINACSVTQKTEAKVRYELNKALKSSASHIIFCGCMSKQLKENTLNISKKRIFLVDDADKAKSVFDVLIQLIYKESLPEQKSSFSSELRSFSQKTRAFIKIQDGCASFCSYCIIPYIRNHLWSRKPIEIIQEIKNVEKSSHSEIVLTGIHIGRYQTNKFDLEAIIKHIIKNTNIERIRLSSIEPLEITDGLLKLFSDEKRLCPHFHIPIQSGSDRILEKMNRKYRYKQFSSIIRKIKSSISDVTVTTDIIVGFPGESDDDFKASLSALEENAFIKTHIFPFSSRSGTKAASLTDKIPENIISKRKKIMAITADHTSNRKKEHFLKKTVSVLFEQQTINDKNMFSGFSKNYLKVIAQSNSDIRNSICNVFLEKIDNKGNFSGKLI
ncbi:MAG: tRNA (N(6)-L-threonylcarbamoyladenosine(37)-C(2))-methylthiotransferase MtaB [Candidatus Aureabacteria bacterium]|nr:tRNA (N(6)-L-threonylcarbamoyladenosine(37)-C(2))-methylthiotransferase MtaB [Candidatus Auribacterota bacterium]